MLGGSSGTGQVARPVGGEIVGMQVGGDAGRLDAKQPPQVVGGADLDGADFTNARIDVEVQLRP